ncbi:MGH1-like glycoside hydrolase domain-containing protein [Asticcacaulis excentricus]|uniref:F5/8 type C domain-containing protein n=1 Tax=Asticcacaulis excentricus TaxID=78587 RepID=A0A3G9FYS3_9CAUL|nr:discoidin domain-containing protein [Asticcacaulis excentricus]BBF80272.1 hypothetical protein EM6_0851 [Asticcacaulis excentricus]
MSYRNSALAAAVMCAFATPVVCAETMVNGILNKDALLAAQSFLDNRDTDWYKANIAFLETPDADLNAVYYYRYDMITKHKVYGSPETGYTLTEFIDRPGWSGAYGAISCPLGLQFSDIRWLRDQRLARDYARYWYNTPGALPRAYSNWFGASMWGLFEAWGDKTFILSMLEDMKTNYRGWEEERFDQNARMFVWNGMQDGMETNINSRQTPDWFRGAEGFRPTLNSYMYADALAISKAAALSGDEPTAKLFAEKAADLKAQVQARLWDPSRKFFFHMFANDEQDGIKAGTLTYQTGKFAGNPHGRELIGYIPWQFNLPDPGYEEAWKWVTDPEGFYARYGLTSVERNDPLFRISRRCCEWSGTSWPYATAQTLEAMANLLNNYQQSVVTKADYYKVLKSYITSQFKDGQPFIAEANNPDTGEWQIVPGHSEHYFHSSYPDLIITGLAGLRPRADNRLEVNPLIPDDWNYFAIDDVPYHGHLVSLVWDKDGKRYGRGAGLSLFVNGTRVAHSPTVQKIEVDLPATQSVQNVTDDRVNFAVNNDGHYFPNIRATYTNPETPLQTLNDGAAWYLKAPANRWTTEGSPNRSDALILNLGAKRPVDYLTLYFLDDEKGIVPPAAYKVEYWTGTQWRNVPGETRRPQKAQGRKPNRVQFGQTIEAERFRVSFTHAKGGFTGLTEIEAWGRASLPLTAPTAPVEDLAYNPGNQPFPKVSASYTSPFDRVEEINDGKVLFTSNSRNRWTAYDSPNSEDWVSVDFGASKTVARLELYLFGDADAVRAPTNYTVSYWDGQAWQPFDVLSRSPDKPRTSAMNTVVVKPVQTQKIRVTFKHDGKGRTGVTELMAFTNP